MCFFVRKRKQKELLDEIHDLYQVCVNLGNENRSFSEYKKVLECLSEFSSNGMQLIGLEQQNGYYYAAVITAIPRGLYVPNVEQQTIYLFRLPNTHLTKKIGRMYVELLPSCKVKIVDWCTTPSNQGYGSMLLKMVIEYFRNAGFQTIVGIISPVDFNHEDLLRHLYGKFGFEITDYETHRKLYLKLRENARNPIRQNSCEVCIRSAEYNYFRNEDILAHDTNIESSPKNT